MKKNRKNHNSEKPKLDPLIGLELTFSNEDTEKDIGDKGITTIDAAKRYQEFLDGVTNIFLSNRFDNVKKIETLQVSKSLGDDDKVTDLKISFKNPSDFDSCKDDSDEEEDKGFWINITRDPKVIEIQTKPFRISDLCDSESLPSNVLNTVFTNIFSDKGAAKYGGKSLTASKHGGGHINVDVESSGLLNFKDVATLIKNWESVEHSETNGLLESEPQTAARIKDSRYHRTEKKFSSKSETKNSDSLGFDLQKALNSEKALNSGKLNLDKFNEAYWKYPQVRIVTNDAKENFIQYGSTEKNEEELKICTHNQAINIEHIFDKEPVNRRIEFREFVAQKSIQNILDGFEIISEVLLKIENIKNKFDKMDLSIKEVSETELSTESSDKEKSKDKKFSDKYTSNQQDQESWTKLVSGANPSSKKQTGHCV